MMIAQASQQAFQSLMAWATDDKVQNPCWVQTSGFSAAFQPLMAWTNYDII